jgi:hypothetical protein
MTYLSIAISIISLAIAVSAFYLSTPKARLKQEQLNCMRVVAGRTAIIFDQISVIATAKKHATAIDDYIFASFHANCGRLEESLDKAIGMGLYATLIGNQDHGLTYFNALSQSLKHITTNNNRQHLEEQMDTMHFVMGIERLMNICLEHRPKLYPTRLHDQLLRQAEPLKDMSRNYLETGNST